MIVSIEYRGRLITGDAYWQESDHCRNCRGGWVASTNSISSIELPCGKELTRSEQILRWLAAVGPEGQRDIESALVGAAHDSERDDWDWEAA